MSTCDRAGANRVAEDGMYTDVGEDVQRLRLPCLAHIASTSSGRGIASMQRDFTGLIASSLAMDAAGQTKELHLCLVAVLLESQLEVLDKPRLPDDHEQNRYLRDLLQLCLPCSAEGERRGELSSSLLTSDIREPMIQLRVPGGVPEH